MHEHRVRMRRKIVARLRKVVTAGNDRFSGCTKLLHCRGNALQIAERGTTHGTELQVHDLGPIVGGCILQRVDDILHQGLRWRVTDQFSQRAIIRIAIQLVDERTDRLQQQCRLRRQQRRCAGHRTHEHREHH